MPNQVNQIPTYVKDLKLIETGGYQDQVIRPFVAELRPDHIENLNKAVDKTKSVGSSKIASNVIAQAMGDAIMPSVAPISKAQIIGGWSERRFRFSLLVESPMPGGYTTQVVYISGYTDHLGVSMSGHLDPNMRLYINNVIVLNKTFNPRTQQYITRVIGHYEVIHTSGGYGFERNNPYDIGDTLQVATPNAVVGNLLTSKVGLDYGENVRTISSSILDPNGESGVTTNTHNLLPADYLSKVVTNTIVTTDLTANSYPDSNDVDILANISSSLTPEDEITNVEFFRRLLHVNQYRPDRPYFTISELEKIDLTLINDNSGRVKVFKGGNMIRTPQTPVQELAPDVFYSTISEDPVKVSEEARLATYLAEAATALMTKYALFDIIISASNITGTPQIVVSSMSTIIPDLDPVSMARYAEAEFANNIYPSITRNNQMVVEIFLHALLEGDINLTISINGNPPVKYTFPKAANALYNPLIQNNNTMESFTNNLGNIIDNVKTEFEYRNYNWN